MSCCPSKNSLVDEKNLLCVLHYVGIPKQRMLKKEVFAVWGLGLSPKDPKPTINLWEEGTSAIFMPTTLWFKCALVSTACNLALFEMKPFLISLNRNLM